MFQKQTLLVFGLIALTLGQILTPKQLLFRYSFDSLPAEDEGAQLKGTPNTYGNPTTTQGKIGNGVRLNANGAQTDLFALGAYIIDAPITITAWFSVDSFALSNDAYYMKIFSNKWQYDDVQGIELQLRAGTWTVITPCNGIGQGCPSGAQITYTLPQNYTADAFHHVAVTYDGNNFVTLYLDGASVASGTVPKPLFGHSLQDVAAPAGQNLHYLSVGGSLYGTTFNQGGEWHGVLDEVRVYNYSLSADQVTAVFNQTSLAVSSNNGGAQPFAEVNCAATTAAATPSLVVYNDLIPKDANGDQLAAFPRNFITLHNNRDTIDPPHQYSNQFPVALFIHNVTTATLKNVGSSAITINSVILADTNNFTLSNSPSAGTSLAAGGTLSFTVAFVGKLAVNIKTAFRTVITISSTDSVQPTLTVNVVGLYMDQPEGSNEVTLSTILAGFGFGTFTSLGAPDNYIDLVNWFYSNNLQDEVTAQYWRAANSNQQVTVQQLVAFGGQSQQQTLEPVHFFNIIYDQTGTLDCGQTVGQRYTNTILPLCNFTGTDNTGAGSYKPCYSTCTPNTRRFYFSIDIQHTSLESYTIGNSGKNQYLSNQISFKFFPVRLSNGVVVQDTYIVAQDYSLPFACGDGEGQANCDYQDNVWIVTNIEPADANSNTMTTRTLPVSFSFGQTVDGNLADKNGNGLQFYDRFSTVYDTAHIFNSYDAASLFLNTAANTLTVTTSAGSLATQQLTNALRVNLNPNGASFSVQVTLDSTTVGNAYAGVILGSDLFNSAVLYVHSGSVYFYVQSQSGFQNTIDVYPTFTTTSSTTTTSQSIPNSAKNITLIIAVNPNNGTLTPILALTGAGSISGTSYTLPQLAPGFGIGPAGRFTGYGVGAGIAAWNDPNTASSNVNFFNFAAYNCGGSFVPPSSSTTQSGTDSNPSSSTSNDGTPTSTATGATNTGTATATNSNTGSLQTAGAASVTASIAVILAAIALIL